MIEHLLLLLLPSPAHDRGQVRAFRQPTNFKGLLHTPYKRVTCMYM